MSVLLSYVPTPEGWAALDLAIKEAILRGTGIVVVNVALGSNFGDITFADEKDLDAVRARLDELGITNEVEQVVGAEDVADAVLIAAAKHDAEMIVVGLRRRSPMGKALLGSNAQSIIVSATCPVLSIRPT